MRLGQRGRSKGQGGHLAGGEGKGRRSREGGGGGWGGGGRGGGGGGGGAPGGGGGGGTPDEHKAGFQGSQPF